MTTEELPTQEDEPSYEDYPLEEGEEQQSLKLLDFFYYDGRIFYPKPNIADQLSKDTLAKVGQYVKDGYDTDLDTMNEWKLLVDFGMKLCKPETQPRSQPWQGACNYKDTMISEAALEFSDRASTELLRNRDLIQIDVVGKDQSEQKIDQAERVSIYENYQLNNVMVEWRDEQDKLIYDLPYSGTVFKKVYYDAARGRNVSDLICYPNFVVDNNTKSVERLRRFSEVFVYPKNIVIEKIRSGLWIDNVSFGENSDDMKTTNDNPNVDNISENDQDLDTRFIEQQTWCDLDEDGYEEPYTVVIQESTGAVVRIMPRFELSNVFIKLEMNEEPYPFMDLKEVKTLGDYLQADLNLDFDVIRIEPNDNLVMYGFIPNPNGDFLYIGYCYMLAQPTQAVNTLTNMLTDSGTLANLPGGYLAKGFRSKMGDLAFTPGQWQQTGLTANELQQGMLPHMYKEPSQTLYSLRNDMIAKGQKYSASADLAGALSPQAPAATTLALVEDQQVSSGAIIKRIYRSMSKEFKKLLALDSMFGDPKVYSEIVDDPKADFFKDFDLKTFDIIPSANPETSSRMMRIQQANAELAHIDLVAGAGGDVRPLVKGYYEAIGCPVTDQVFPDMSPEEQMMDLLKRNPQLEDMIMGAKQQNDLITAVQADQTHASTQLMTAQAQKLSTEAQIKLASFLAEKQKTEAEVRKTDSETLLNLEKAEVVSTEAEIKKFSHATNLDNPQEIMNDQNAATGMARPPNNSGNT